MTANSKVKGPPSQVLSRKEKRKAERKLKKARKDAFAHRKFDVMKDLKDIDTEYEQKQETEKEIVVKNSKKKRKAKNKKNKKEQKIQNEEKAKHGIEEDELELHQLEKRLNLHKRKGANKLPQSFMDDGLDYLLDATESDKIKGLDDIGPKRPILGDSESDSEFDGDESIGDGDESIDDGDSVADFSQSWNPDTKAGKSILKNDKQKKKTKSVKFDAEVEDNEEEDDNDLVDDSEMFSEDDDEDVDEFEMEEDDDIKEDGEGEELTEEESDETKADVNKKRKREEKKESELKEDIYGRLKDKEGKVVKSTYVPPAKRAMMTANQPNEALQKKLKGLVNKLSEASMQVLSSQVESLYMDHSRADVNETLAGLVMDAVITPALAQERLVAEMTMLYAILHSNVGQEVGAFFLQKLAVKFKELLDVPEYGLGKTMDNVLMLISNMYNFKMVSSTLIIDIMKTHIDRFSIKDIELLLLLFKTVGFTLRKDDPVQLKQVILDVQAKARESEFSTVEGMEYRVKFMLEVLTAIRNNNMRKIPGYDPTHLEHLRKLIKSFLRGQVLGDNMLTIGLEDLLKADQCGRWWIVGSAWEGRQSSDGSKAKGSTLKQDLSEESGISKQMLKLAKQQGMNTDVRRHIFCILGTSEDFEDAFARLLRLGLNRSQEREIIHVIYHCCLNEKTYNPFYAYLTEKFCAFDRRFLMTVQFTMWDKFKEVDTMSKETRVKLGSFLSHLIISKALSLSVLKVVEFGMESKKIIRLLVQVLGEILTTSNFNTVKGLFERLAPLPKLRTLCQGLQVFMRVHLKGMIIKGMSSLDLQERIEKVESAMFSTQSMVL